MTESIDSSIFQIDGIPIVFISGNEINGNIETDSMQMINASAKEDISPYKFILNFVLLANIKETLNNPDISLIRSHSNLLSMHPLLSDDQSIFIECLIPFKGFIPINEELLPRRLGKVGFPSLGFSELSRCRSMFVSHLLHSEMSSNAHLIQHLEL